MLFLKRIQNIFCFLALLITLISFSGFVSVSSNYEKPKTELVNSNHTVNKCTSEYSYSTQKVTVNQYTLFCFKSLLTSQKINYSIALKSQKKAVLQFIDFNSCMEQHLIAKTLSNNSYNIFIE